MKGRGNGFLLFAGLLERLLFTPARNSKLALLAEYFRTAPPGDRGYALALLTGSLALETLRPSQLRRLAMTRVDEVLFKLSQAYVGDLGETIALIWPEPEQGSPAWEGDLEELVARVKGLTRLETFPFMDQMLGRLPETGRWIFVKLVTGGSLRIGVSARLAKQGLAQAFGADVEEIEKVWSGFRPPYGGLLDWLEGKTPSPVPPEGLFFHPPMLAVPLEEKELERMDPAAFAAEWKWDGVRVQASSDGIRRRLFTRNGEEITEAFPEVAQALPFHSVVDGELLVRRDGGEGGAPRGLWGDIGDFQHLQKRLNRKKVSAKLLEESPALMVCYDLLFENGEDLRPLPFRERRERLEQWVQALPSEGRVFRLSPRIPFRDWDALKELRRNARNQGLEGLMLKRLESPYLNGRPKGHWYKWKRDPLNVDAVLLYAQRGHGKRASFYSDYTFGVWEGGELVPIGKAYSGFSDEELVRLDRWIRENTVGRFGVSIRAVKAELVLEVEFDGLQRSSRHRSGVAMRFPRIHRIRWDKPAGEADTLEAVRRLLPEQA